MSENNHMIIRIVLGAILAFQGAKLIGTVLQERPENYIMFVALGIVFIAIGVVFAVNYIKKYIQFMKNDTIDIISYEDMKKAETKIDDLKEEDESCE